MRISKSMKLKLAFAAALLAGSIFAQEPEYGPAKGTLVIQGGGSDVGTGIFETFINKAGGLGANIVVVPTAGGNKNQDGSWKVYNEEQVVAGWKKRGVNNVHMLHTHDPKVADTEEFAKILRDANGVWFDGGRQWNVVDSYANTLTLQEFHKVLERGGVIGGSSAGATIQGDYLVRGAIAGSEIVMTPEPEHEHGFAFLRKVAIDQHINTRNRWDDIIPVIKKISQYAGNRTVGRHGDRCDRRPVSGDRKVEGCGTRQHSRLSALGKTLLCPVHRRRIQHEDARHRKIRNWSAGPACGQAVGQASWPVFSSRNFA